MPPRYAFWTILIDGKPTAFRAREREELVPTFQQLRRTNKDVVFKWFARRGRPWREDRRGDTTKPARPRDERPPREERPPDRRESEAPPKPRPNAVPEPPTPEQIVIKPEPPERG